MGSDKLKNTKASSSDRDGDDQSEPISTEIKTKDFKQTTTGKGSFDLNLGREMGEDPDDDTAHVYTVENEEDDDIGELYYIIPLIFAGVIMIALAGIFLAFYIKKKKAEKAQDEEQNEPAKDPTETEGEAESSGDPSPKSNTS